MRARRGWLAAIAALAAVPLLSGCSAKLSQFIDIAPDGGGTLSLELRLDPAAQQAINLPRQLSEGTFQRFLDVRTERWRAPGNTSLPFAQETRPNGTVVLRSVRRLKAGTSQLDDLESALGVERPLQPILTATGRYWAAPNRREAPNARTTTTPTSGTAPEGEAQAGITGLPQRVSLQAVLVDEFTPAYTERGRKYFSTFSIGSRGGVGDLLEAPCNAGSRRIDFTRADRALQRGLDFSYTWAMPAKIALFSTGAKVSGDGYVARWDMPYGSCLRMEMSSAGAEDGRVVNGIILGAAVLFLGLVFALRAVSRRRRKDTPADADDQ